MGARLEYVMQPVAFGVGTGIVAMVGTNWGARQYHRARQIAWTGAITIAVVCGTIGLSVAMQPNLWIGLFSNDPEVARIGALYLQIVGPAYLCFGLGLGLFYVSLGIRWSRRSDACQCRAPDRERRRWAGSRVLAWFRLFGLLCSRCR